jgi:hypothetical protein
MIRIGETRRHELAEDVRSSVARQAESADLFETLLATLQLLSAQSAASGSTPANLLGLKLDEQWVRSLLADDRQSPTAKAMAVRYLTEVDQPESIQLVLGLAQSSDPALASEAVHTLAGATDKSVAPALLALAGDIRQPNSLRCDAIVALVDSEARNTEALLPFVSDSNAQLALTAVRALTAKVEQESVRQAFQSALGTIASGPDAAGRFDQLRSQFVEHRSREDARSDPVLDSEPLPGEIARLSRLHRSYERRPDSPRDSVSFSRRIRRAIAR